MQIKSYSNVWSVQGLLYAVGDFKLPFSLTFQQIGWYLAGAGVMLVFGDAISNGLVQYLLIPGGFAWVMSQKNFEGKNPVEYIKTVLGYLGRPKQTYGGKKVPNMKKYHSKEEFTVVRSEMLDAAHADKVRGEQPAEKYL